MVAPAATIWPWQRLWFLPNEADYCASRLFISGVVGVGLGAVSGYFAGAVCFLIQKFVEVIWAFPPLLLAIAIMAYLGQGFGNLFLALVIQRRISYSRVARGQALCMALHSRRY